MNRPQIIVAYSAESAITRRRIVAHGETEGKTKQEADKTDLLIGVSTAIDTAEGQHCDVIRSGFALVEYGDDITINQPLTSNAEGKAIPAEPGDFYIGFAEYSGVEEDIGSVFIVPGYLPAAASPGA